MPRLTDKQLDSFRRVTPGEHARFKAMARRGRPKKAANEKEVGVSMRFPPDMLLMLKARAQQEGTKWQTYAKKLLRSALAL